MHEEHTLPGGPGNPSFLTARHERLWALVEPSYRHGDLAHDAAHVGRVYRWALKLARAEGEDPDLAGACALVHDQVHVPKDAAQRSEASALSARAATAPLSEAGYSEAEVTAIVAAVTGSGWSSGQAPQSRLGAVLQDADRLDALGAVGVARTFATAQTMVRGEAGHAFYHDEDPFWRDSSRTLNDKRYALDHFYRKLLRLADGMHCATARQEARRRHRFMLEFLRELAAEI